MDAVTVHADDAAPPKTKIRLIDIQAARDVPDRAGGKKSNRLDIEHAFCLAIAFKEATAKERFVSALANAGQAQWAAEWRQKEQLKKERSESDSNAACHDSNDSDDEATQGNGSDRALLSRVDSAAEGCLKRLARLDELCEDAEALAEDAEEHIEDLEGFVPKLQQNWEQTDLGAGDDAEAWLEEGQLHDWLYSCFRALLGLGARVPMAGEICGTLLDMLDAVRDVREQRALCAKLLTQAAWVAGKLALLARARGELGAEQSKAHKVKKVLEQIRDLVREVHGLRAWKKLACGTID
eukprot:g1429.t1